MTTKFNLLLSLAFATAASTAAIADTHYDINKPAWFNGLIVQTYAQIPGPGGPLGPSDELDDTTVYLVGHIFDVSPFGGEIVIDQLPPEVPLPFITVPAHDDVFSNWSTEHHPTDGFGLWVVAGPSAVTDGAGQNVKLRPMPDFSLAMAPLAYEIKVKGKWRPLTNAKMVEKGINLGLLSAIPSGPDNGFGGVGWLEPGVKR